MSWKLANAAVLGLLAVALLASSAQAQAPRRPGGGFGFGGGRGGGIMSLTGNEAVQKELAVGEAEVAKLRTLGEEYRKAMQEEMSAAGLDFQALQNVPEAEREAKRAEFRTRSTEVSTKVRAKFEPKLKDILSADQVKRLKEINLQNAGVGAYADADVVKTLGLSDEQQKKITDIRADLEKSQQGLFGGGGNPQEAFAKIRELGDAAEKKANDVLTDTQKTDFTALKGKAFDTALLRSGFGGGRPGGPGAPGGKGRPGGNPGAQPNRPATE